VYIFTSQLLLILMGTTLTTVLHYPADCDNGVDHRQSSSAALL